MASNPIDISGLTAECLRDIARNESASRAYRRAAIKFLMDRNHKFQYNPDFWELRAEIIEEQEAAKDVQALVESAVESPLQSVNELPGDKEMSDFARELLETKLEPDFTLDKDEIRQRRSSSVNGQD